MDRIDEIANIIKQDAEASLLNFNLLELANGVDIKTTINRSADDIATVRYLITSIRNPFSAKYRGVEVKIRLSSAAVPLNRENSRLSKSLTASDSAEMTSHSSIPAPFDETRESQPSTIMLLFAQQVKDACEKFNNQ
tara:strand:- start:1163 stop:1573 length:411 start_codon:yes stop_codon:yes gene_type:complete